MAFGFGKRFSHKKLDRIRSPRLWIWTGMVLGLTGGIGCGKSTVGRMLEERGMRRIDTDAIVHQLLSSDAKVIAEVGEAFGEEVVDGKKGVNRKALGEVVFAQPEGLRRLEAILHPRVGQIWQGRVASDPSQLWVVEIPLLFEKKLQNKFDFTACVFCNQETQVRRLEQKGVSRSQALARMGRQLPLDVKAEKADFVLTNDGSLLFLEGQAIRLLVTLTDI